MWMAHLGSITKRLSWSGPPCRRTFRKTLLIASTAPKALAASSLLPPSGSGLLQQRAGLGRPGAREGLRAERAAGERASACAAGIGARGPGGRGRALWSLRHGSLRVYSRCTRLLTAGADGRNRLHRLRLLPTEQKQREQARPSSASLLYRPGAVALDTERGPRWPTGGRRRQRPDGESGQAEEANGTSGQCEGRRPPGAGEVSAAPRLEAAGSLECPHEVELLPVLAGEDGGLFVVLHQLVHGVEPPLPDAVDAVHELHLEVFVLP